MEIFGIGITILSVVIAVQTIKNGKWIKEILKTINEQGEIRHREVMGQQQSMQQSIIELIKTIKIQHQDVVELLKRGFGDLSRDVKELKSNPGNPKNA